MAISQIRAQITFQGASGSPDDRYVNNLAFEGSNLVADLADLHTAITNFYTDVPTGGTSSIIGLMSEQVAADGHQIRYYDLAVAPPSLPILIEELVLPVAPTADGYPEEVAWCMSFRGAPVAGNNTGPGPHLPARRRGRIYIGPLAEVVGVNGVPSVRPDMALADDVLLSADDTLGASLLANGYEWGVWSPTDAALYPVQLVWMDNAFDTQRRRGAAPNARVTRVIP